MQGVVAFLVTNLLQIYYRIFQFKKLKISEDLTEIWPQVCCHSFFMDRHSVMKQ